MKGKYENSESQNSSEQKKIDKNKELHDLYIFQKIKRKNLECSLNSKYTFKPVINTYYKIQTQPFFERNEQFLKRVADKRNK